MKLAHAADNCLAGFVVDMNPKSGVFFGQPLQRDTHFLLIGFGFGLNGNADRWFGESNAFQDNWVHGFAKGSLGLGLRSISSPFLGFVPQVLPRSNGLGRKSLTRSSSFSTITPRPSPPLTI